ncbi:unnamed protein product [Candida verbasci]|uniref:WD repeat-containing protein n=1 Tax=Candida verbasci TaxID=1227364 RepID=A0A9W4TQ86_9ASCO|nr:unnamed protein product [Candida verbasci]
MENAKLLYTWNSSIIDQWILKIIVINDDIFIVSTSNGYIIGYHLTSFAQLFKIKAHDSCINDMIELKNNKIATCSIDGVKIWDIKEEKLLQILTNSKNSTFLSLAFNNNLLASGTELVGQDAELHIWDTTTYTLKRSFIDSHRDDITSIQFHPILKNYLMSGSTDGYVNIYNLNEIDEDDALHQVINFNSVHSCHFSNMNRISILSHMETFIIHDLNDTNYEDENQGKFIEFGDLRNKWENCKYVITIDPKGFVAYGSNNESKLSLIPFNPKKEKFKVDKIVHFPEAHGEEVVRDLKLVGNDKVLTCGEDGSIKLWQLPNKLKTYSLAEDVEDVDMEDCELSIPKVEKSKKDKSRSKHKSKKKDRKFKPY